MKLSVAYLSHFGNIREKNEDSILIQNKIHSKKHQEKSDTLVLEEKNMFFVVADGMGGHAKGEIASKTVLEILKSNAEKIYNYDSLDNVISLAKKKLDDIAQKDPDSYSLGTTIAGMLFREEQTILFSSGDSRIYRINNNKPERLTKDHSLVQYLVDTGIITEEQMNYHPQKNIITSAIIGDLQDEKPSIYYRELDIKTGDMFLLCTDGAWESLTSEELIDCLQADSISKKVNHLLERILEVGGSDNVSIIIVEVLES